MKKGPDVQEEDRLRDGTSLAWMKARRRAEWREFWHCGFGLLVDWGMIESPCGTPRPEGVVAVVCLFCQLTGDWWN